MPCNDQLQVLLDRVEARLHELAVFGSVDLMPSTTKQVVRHVPKIEVQEIVRHVPKIEAGTER